MYSLTTNYRNSAEIFAVAAGVIRRAMPDLPLPRAVRRTGVDPVDVVVEASAVPLAVRESAQKLLADVDGTIGVIAAVPRRDEVARWVEDLIGVRLQVVTTLQAKGMEYDAVVLVEPSEVRADPAGTRMLYVALSRATQRLTTVGSHPGWQDQGADEDRG